MSTTDRLASDDAQVRQGFWPKARQTLGKIPFSDDAVAAFYCATDSATPLPIRATLMGALAYFILPIDAIPDILLGLGYTDDAAVLLTAFTTCKTYINDDHRTKARAWLIKERGSPAA
jgi:uncharacterized membrane protein YkvA (DUF1232 family)